MDRIDELARMFEGFPGLGTRPPQRLVSSVLLALPRVGHSASSTFIARRLAIPSGTVALLGYF